MYIYINGCICPRCVRLCSIRQVGDGTTSVVLLAGEILKHVKSFVEDGLHPQASQMLTSKLGLCGNIAFTGQWNIGDV